MVGPQGSAPSASQPWAHALEHREAHRPKDAPPAPLTGACFTGPGSEGHSGTSSRTEGETVALRIGTFQGRGSGGRGSLPDGGWGSSHILSALMSWASTEYHWQRSLECQPYLSNLTGGPSSPCSVWLPLTHRAETWYSQSVCLEAQAWTQEASHMPQSWMGKGPCR